MPHPLDGCLAKLNRGEEQLHALKDAVNEFRASEFFEPSLEVDRQGRVAIRALNVREPPTSLAVLAGECANSFRSGLDYLAYQLAIQHSGDPLPQRIARATQYPILSSGPKFRERAPRQLVGITPKARAAIERLQPYHRKLVPNARSLRWLHEISNVDKHRDLHPIGSMLVGSQVGIASSSGRWTLDQYELFPGPLTERAMARAIHRRVRGRGSIHCEHAA